MPVYRLAELAKDENAAPRGYVRLPEAPDEAFVAQLEVDTLESVGGPKRRPLARGAWAVWIPTAPEDLQRDTWQLLISSGQAFGATGEHWTVGRPYPRPSYGLVKVRYASTRCRPPTVSASELRSRARLWGYFDGVEFKRILG